MKILFMRTGSKKFACYADQSNYYSAQEDANNHKLPTGRDQET
jgi:hypothetical protein